LRPIPHWHDAGEPELAGRLPTQLEPPVHTTPQAPQLSLFVDRLTHAPLQSVVPATEQAVAHTPLIQTSPAKHELPQVPQSNGFVAVSRHTPLQLVVPTGHWHVLAAQVMPPVHAFAQAPQLALSDARSTQPPAHAVRPVEQAATHEPELHTKLAAQPLPQAPQLAGLV
jgi:hypothetical protein